MSARILIVDDDPLVPRTLRILFRKHGFEAAAAAGTEEALAFLGEEPRRRGDQRHQHARADGFELLRQVKQRHPAIEVVLVTGYGTIQNAVRGMRDGAFDYVHEAHPGRGDGGRRGPGPGGGAAPDRERGPPRPAGHRRSRCRAVGRDPTFLKVFEAVEAVAATRATVLITGESGTGSPWWPGRSTNRAARKDSPFVEINCGAPPGGPPRERALRPRQGLLHRGHRLPHRPVPRRRRRHDLPRRDRTASPASR